MNENPALEAGKEEDEYEKTSLKNDYDDYDDAEGTVWKQTTSI
jgi:RNA polymerase sigma-54 factor